MRSIEAAKQQFERLRLPAQMLRFGVSHVLADVLLENKAARRRVDELATNLRGDDLGYVLMLGDGGDFRVGEIAQTDAIFQGQHLAGPPRQRVAVLGFSIVASHERSLPSRTIIGFMPSAYNDFS